MKILSPTIHGVLDYAVGAAFLLAPTLLGFREQAAVLSYVIGVLFIGAAIVTRYPLGLLKLLPFPVHGVIETIMALGFIAAPWLFGFSGQPAARNFFVGAGVALLAVVAMTDYKATSSDSSRPAHA